MNREEVLAKCITFAAQAFGKDEAEVREDTKIAEELGVRSAQRIAMAASVENEFDVMIPVASFGKFGTIGELVDYVMDEM